ncbi:cryptochrome/photolyase family protein [Ruegeria aquimaris]|uniref:DNA photolyase family protein n=1 Tax=Ruegeria aquimaris TaxID=2984333 RepID=A0ABT3AE87_9RHOB|nr:deoxyribodipyrimidine photo-lyase [Ruegeria sp. XHP0148]MCV2886877.1 DNA photolyase family protein [Ruegeria sp. XHP0148]
MTNSDSPIIFWFRRDLRITDHPGFHAACATGRPVIPVFLHDEGVERLGAAPKFRLGLGLAAFAAELERLGSALILRRGPALQSLQALVEETGAGAVWWTRGYDSVTIDRDTGVKTWFNSNDIDARSFPGHLLFEPWKVTTVTGGYYKVYSPFWRAVCQRDVGPALPAPSRFVKPAFWPETEALSSWQMDAPVNRAAPILRRHQSPGEVAALAKLDRFIGDRIGSYKNNRDFPALDATSELSDHFSLGELSPRIAWHRAQEAMRAGSAGAEHFLKELVWREFAYHLMFNSPRILDRNWREEWDNFPWSEDPENPGFVRWCRGQTGVPMVDAAMREMYVTGRMHNRARMIAASYLTKHLMIHWKLGMDWFAECLTDWDPASNAMGWQWVAGSGPDAAPYFRVFNPETQAAKFDPDGAYVNRWVAEGQARPAATALEFFDAIPRGWGLSPEGTYPIPGIALDAGRKRALAAYSTAFPPRNDAKLA